MKKLISCLLVVLLCISSPDAHNPQVSILPRRRKQMHSRPRTPRKSRLTRTLPKMQMIRRRFPWQGSESFSSATPAVTAACTTTQQKVFCA